MSCTVVIFLVFDDLNGGCSQSEEWKTSILPINLSTGKICKVFQNNSNALNGNGKNLNSTFLKFSTFFLNSLSFFFCLSEKKKLNEFKKKVENFKNVEFKFLPFPLSAFELFWNTLHILPVERFIGKIDVFHSSDWLQPPFRSSKTKKITTVHDMVVYLFPSSVHPRILANQKRRLKQVKKEADLIIAPSYTTKEDIINFLQIPQEKIKVVYSAASEIFKSEQDDRIEEVLQKYKIKKPYILS